MFDALSLTEDLVQRVHRQIADVGYDGNVSVFGERDYDDHLNAFLKARPNAPIHVFAYGSLIWKPAFQPASIRRGTACGWRRSFCLRIKRFRGTRERPGLMMALDRGGSCEGILQRLVKERELLDLRMLWRREMTAMPPTNTPRWIDIESEGECVQAIAFTANPDGTNYVGNLAPVEVAEILAAACGSWGSGAAYLRQTTLSLEKLGIRDAYLWQLQNLVAERIIASTTS